MILKRGVCFKDIIVQVCKTLFECDGVVRPQHLLPWKHLFSLNRETIVNVNAHLLPRTSTPPTHPRLPDTFNATSLPGRVVSIPYSCLRVPGFKILAGSRHRDMASDAKRPSQLVQRRRIASLESKFSEAWSCWDTPVRALRVYAYSSCALSTFIQGLLRQVSTCPELTCSMQRTFLRTSHVARAANFWMKLDTSSRKFSAVCHSGTTVDNGSRKSFFVSVIKLSAWRVRLGYWEKRVVLRPSCFMRMHLPTEI